MYKKIFLHGFRATGKSTLAKKLAEKLGWDYIEIDKQIENLSGKSIDQLTNGGTMWEEFRKFEQDVIKKLSDKENIVVSTGGGTAVNNVLHKDTGETFGKENFNIIKKMQDVLNVNLTADEDIIAKRIEETEMAKNMNVRPVLNEKRAEELFDKIKLLADNPEEIKKLSVKTIIEDAIDMFRSRKPLYEKISDFMINTGDETIDNSIKKIIEKVSQ